MGKKTKQIRTRFAPSPTGAPHVGNIRTALFAWLFARHNNGTFVLRIEDTDQTRAQEGSVESILSSLDWLGIDRDEGIISATEEKGEKGPYFQSKRLEIYKEHAQMLVDAGKAYPCFCSHGRLAVLKELQKSKSQPPRYDGLCKTLQKNDVSAKLKEGDSHVIRMNISEQGETSFEDAVKGNVTVQNSTINDQVLLKSDGFPTYHLASVVDDHLMEISHVIRADEWLASTPKHVLLYQFFGWVMPAWVHLPIILGQDKSKLSKRHGAVSALEFRDQGYVSDALVNYLALLGWNPKTEKEVMSREELIKEFDLAKINKNNPIFDNIKLNWMNKQYIQKMSEKELVSAILPLRAPREYSGQAPSHEATAEGDGAKQSDRRGEHVIEAQDNDKIAAVASTLPRNDIAVIKLVKDRMEKLTDYDELTGFLHELSDYKPEVLIPKGLDKTQTKEMLQNSFDILEKVTKKKWNEDDLRKTMFEYLEEHDIKKGDMLWPTRVSVTGLEKSPDLFGVMDVLGKEESLKRIEQGIEKL